MGQAQDFRMLLGGYFYARRIRARCISIFHDQQFHVHPERKRMPCAALDIVQFERLQILRKDMPDRVFAFPKK